MPTQDVIVLNAQDFQLSFGREWFSVAEIVPRIRRINVASLAAHGLIMTLKDLAFPSLIFPDLEAVTVEGVTFAAMLDERRPPTRSMSPDFEMEDQDGDRVAVVGGMREVSLSSTDC